MKNWLFVIIFCFPAIGFAQQEIIYQEDKVPAYSLPDLLTAQNGRKISSSEEWIKFRRPELLSTYSTLVYGITPTEKIDVKYRIVANNKEALNGTAQCKQVEFTFSNGNRSMKSLMILYLPNKVKGRVPVFMGYNFLGNETIHPDPQIKPSFSANLDIWPTRDKSRGANQRRWPLELIVKSGYGVATMCYSDIYPDKDHLTEKSILPLFTGYNKEENNPESWQAIGAWAWGLSRMADYLQLEKFVDHEKLVVIGHSRLGKAALWAGAQDTRFAMVVSNNSGCGGAALFNRKFGETASSINNAFPHWFCRNFRQFNNREEYLPVDQHQLIALMAPRPVYIASATEDLWADPRGEYLGGFHANPVYALWKLPGLVKKDTVMPNTPLQEGYIGYHIREGKHDILSYDWQQYIRFADKHFYGR